MVYLHNARGIATATVGVTLAWMAAFQLALAAPAGSLVDKIGPRRVLMIGVTIMGIGTLLLAFVEAPWQVFAATTVMAVGGAGLWSPTSAMLASMVPAEQRQRAFGIQFALLNLGIGVGGLISSAIIDVDRVGSFQILYTLDALTFFGYAGILLTMRGVGGPVWRGEAASRRESDLDAGTSEQSTKPDGGEAGWRLVLQDRVLRRVVFMALLAISSGYAQFEAGYTAFATQQADLQPRLLGIAFAANTGMIVASQMLVLKRLEGRSRTGALTIVLVIWAASWLFVGAAGLVPAPAAMLPRSQIVAPAIRDRRNQWAPDHPGDRERSAPPSSWPLQRDRIHDVEHLVDRWPDSCRLPDRQWSGRPLGCRDRRWQPHRRGDGCAPAWASHTRTGRSATGRHRSDRPGRGSGADDRRSVGLTERP
jgi:MFS family permease